MENSFLITDCVLIPTEGSSLKEEHRLNRGNPIISYFESIMSPSISLSVSFIDADQLISNEGITGGEYIFLRITVPGYDDFEITPDKHFMMLNSVKDVKTSARKQEARLEFVSVESIVNETARLSKKFAGPVPNTVRDILVDDERGIKTTKKVNTDNGANSYSFVGNLKRPFDTIQWLCPKTSSSTSGFGFLFFETLDGYEFKSIESLLNSEAVEYKKTEKPSETEVEDDFRILENNLDRTNDIGLNCRMGMYANKTIYVNIDDGSLKYVDFRLDSLNLKNSPKLPNQLETYPTRLMLRVLDKGALQKGSEKEQIENENELAIYQSKSYARTNSLFSQSIRIAIPFNPDLRAGQMLNLRFPFRESEDENATNFGDEDTIDVSGRFLISELRHDLGDNKSSTTLKLIRDTYTA